MLTIVRNEKGNVLFRIHGNVTVETIDMEKELELFDPDAFIQEIRNKQAEKKEQNRERYRQLKERAEENGFLVYDEGFFPEYTKDTCYGETQGTVLALEKDGLTIDFWINGIQRYYLFNDEKFCRILQYEGVNKNLISQASAQKLKKAVYYCMKLSLDGIFSKNDYFNPVDEIINGNWLILTKQEKDFLTSFPEEAYFSRYDCEDMHPDKLPVAWHVGYASCGNNNWIEIFFDKDNQQINEGEVFGGYDFLDALEEMDDWYQMGLEYLKEN